MIIYGSTISPYVRKTVVFAVEKGIDFELVTVGGAAPRPPEFEEASPFGKIPGLKDGDFLISDSTAIITYLDAIKPEPNLIPTDPKNRARTIWWEEYGDTILTACGGKIVFNRLVAPVFMKRQGDLAVADAAQTVELPPILDYLEKMIPASGFLVEDRFTLADISVASPLATMGYAGCAVDKARHPKVAAYVEAIHARPSFQQFLTQEKGFLKAVGVG